MVLVVFDHAGGKRLAGQRLQFRIERGANRQTALVQLLLAIAIVDFATHFLGEILAGEDMRTGGTRGDRERRLLFLLAVVSLDVSVLDHAIDDVIAPLGRALALTERMQRRRRLRQRCKIGGFRHRQLMHRLVEIQKRGRRNAISREAEIDFVQIELENLVLGVGALDLHREQRFRDLAGERHLVREQEVLRHLLGDRRGALGTAAGAVILHEQDARAHHALKIEPAMLVEVLVLGRQERVNDPLRHCLDRQIQATLARIFGDQRPVGRMHPRHHRRLVILQLRVIRQVLRVMPHQTGDAGDADQKQDRARPRTESRKSAASVS